MKNLKNSFAAIGTLMGPSGLRSHARVCCTECPNVYEEAVTGGRPFAPLHTWKRARRAGWEIPSVDSRSNILCPTCCERRHNKARHDPDELIRSIPAPPAEEIPSMPVSPMTSNKAQAPSGQPLRDPTHEERLKIRGLLDSYFDDKLGSYLSGYSDQKIGNELNVPWAIVTKIREAAYGPIRVDPEVERLSALAQSLQAEGRLLMKQATELNARAAEIEAGIKALRERRAG